MRVIKPYDLGEGLKNSVFHSRISGETLLFLNLSLQARPPNLKPKKSKINIVGNRAFLTIFHSICSSY